MDTLKEPLALGAAVEAILDEEDAINESITSRVTSKVPTPFNDNAQLNSL